VKAIKRTSTGGDATEVTAMGAAAMKTASAEAEAT
jgi:hypothetical protein